MELNKIFAAVLVAGIIAMVTGFVAEQLVRPEALEQNAYVVETGEEPAEAEGAAPAEPALPDIGTLLASADPAAGQGLIRACQACHSFEQGGADKLGPNLWDIVGRPIAGVEGFGYSDALRALDGEWTYENLNGFLHAPREWAPGTAMSYAGVKDDQDRANLIAWLGTLSDQPVPFPEPAEAGAAPAEGAAGAEAATAAEGADAPAPKEEAPGNVPAAAELGEQGEPAGTMYEDDAGAELGAPADEVETEAVETEAAPPAALPAPAAEN